LSLTTRGKPPFFAEKGANAYKRKPPRANTHAGLTHQCSHTQLLSPMVSVSAMRSGNAHPHSHTTPPIGNTPHGRDTMTTPADGRNDATVPRDASHAMTTPANTTHTHTLGQIQ
jgi:hypothetical protein